MTTRSHVPRARRAHRLLGTALLALGALTVAGCSDDDTVAPAATSDLQRIADSVVRANAIPGVVIAVRRAGEEPTIVASGKSDLASGRRLATADRFRVGSLTKPMVASVILQLAEEGKLALDDPLARWVPGVLPDADRITLRQLLNHTSGIPSYNDDPAFFDAVLADPARAWSPQELVAVARAMPRVFEPGAANQWSYSNTNYTLLGLVVEAASGQPLATALEARIFTPLGMTSTYYGTGKALRAPFAQGYVDLDGAPNFPVGTELDPSWGGAAGAVVSTARDALVFVEALADGRLVSAASQAARLATVPASTIRFPGDTFDSAYGLGVLVGGGWVGHNGSIPGYETEAQAKPGVGSVVVLVNETTDGFVAMPIATLVRERLLGAR